MEDALFEREAGADEGPLELVVSLPRDEGLVDVCDVDNVGLEPALVEGPVRGVGADPVAVAQAVARRLGLREPKAKNWS